MNIVLTIFEIIGALFKAILWTLGAIFNVIVWTVHAAQETAQWFATYGSALLGALVALAVVSAVLRIIPWAGILDALDAYLSLRRGPPEAVDGWRCRTPVQAPVVSAVRDLGLQRNAEAAGSPALDPIGLALRGVDAWLDESPLSSSSATVILEKWTRHWVRPASRTRFAVDAFRTSVAIPHVVLSEAATRRAALRAVNEFVASPVDGDVARRLVDELTAEDVQCDVPATICLTVVRLRGIDARAGASSAATVELALTSDPAQEPVLLLVEDEEQSGSSDAQGSGTSMANSLVGLGPVPRSQGRPRSIDAHAWATQVFAHHRELTPLLRIERPSRSRLIQLGLRPWSQRNFLRQPSCEPPSGSRVAEDRLIGNRIDSSGLTTTRESVTLRRQHPLPPGHARVIAGVHGHKELDRAGIGIFYLPGLCPADRVDVRDSSNVTVANHCRIRDTAHFHVQRIALDWRGLERAEMRDALRQLRRHPGRASIDAVQDVARRLVPRSDAMAAHTTSSTVQGDAEITIHGADTVNLKDHASVQVNRHYTIDLTTISVLCLLADDAGLVKKLGAAFATSSAAGALVHGAATRARRAGDVALLAGAELAEAPALVSWLFGRVDVLRADNVTIGTGNRTSFRTQVGVSWLATVDAQNSVARGITTNLGDDLDEDLDVGHRLAGQPNRPASHLNQFRNGPGSTGFSGPSAGP